MSLDFTCSVCGNGLEVLVCTDGSGFNVTPCPTCQSTVVSDGYNMGYADSEKARREHDEYIQRVTLWITKQRRYLSPC